MDKYLFPQNKIMKKYLLKQYENMGKNRTHLENVNIEGLRTQSMNLGQRKQKKNFNQNSLHHSSISATYPSPDIYEEQLTLRA